MAITYVGSNTTETASATTVDVPLPAGLQQNDFVLVLVSHGATTNETFSEDGGTWTKANNADLYSNDTRDNNAGLFYKRMGATPDSSVTITSTSSSSMVALSVAYRGVDTTTPLDTAITTTQTTTNTANVNSPAIVPVTDNCAILTMGGSAGLVSGLTVTAPANYNEMVQKSHSSQNVTVVSAWRTLATAASENPANYVFSTSDTSSCYNAFSVALRPSSGVSPLNADAGSYTLTGTAAALEFDRTVDAGAGSYVLTGQAATLNKGLTLVADAGSYALTGADAALEFDRQIVADAGSYALTGTDADLTLVGALELAADGGSYVLTGTSADLTYTPLQADQPETPVALHGGSGSAESDIAAYHARRRARMKQIEIEERKRDEAKLSLETEHKKLQAKKVSTKQEAARLAKIAKLNTQIVSFDQSITKAMTELKTIETALQAALVAEELRQQTIADRRRRLLLVSIAAA